MTLPPAVLWIDPGKMTGLALYHHPFGQANSYGEYACHEFDFEAAGGHIKAFCEMYQDYLSVGWEKFTIFPKTPAADAHHAIEMIGVARYHALRYHCRILTPAAPEQRKMATREMLEAIGWWVPGKDDAQSAAQHLLAWLLRTGNTPAREAGILAALRH
jgi:hypothetical protein